MLKVKVEKETPNGKEKYFKIERRIKKKEILFAKNEKRIYIFVLICKISF